MSRARIAALAVPLAVLALVLTACNPGGSPDSATDEPSPAATETVEPTEEPAGPTFTLPADCTAIASAATLSTVFGQIDSRPPNGLTRPAPASAAKTLECSWFTGDTTGGDIIYYAAPAADSQAYLSVMQANGFTCAAALEGTRCDKTTPNSQFPVDTVETTVTRDDVWIYISMTNVDAAALLPDMVATAWAA
jgi:hypothetical protein